MRGKPSTGQRRKANRPLLIDRLPVEMQERIRLLRVAGKTFREIERESSTWKEWAQVPEEVRILFASCPDGAKLGQPRETGNGKLETVVYRLPHTNLCRWYDLRIEQVLREQQLRFAAAHALADRLAAGGFQNLTASVKHALGEFVFAVMEAGEDSDKITAALTNLGHLLAKFDRNEIASRRVQLLEEEAERKKRQFERETNEAARKLEKGRSLTIDDINRIRERTFGLGPIEPEAAADHPA
jgi:hypothetical protein